MSERILVLDDHELLAHSLSFALQARGFAAEPLRLSDYATLVDRVRTDPPDVVLLDMQLGGEVGHGARLVQPFTDAGVRVLMVSGVTDEAEVATCIEAGAVGYVCKSEPFEVLLDVASRVAHGEEVFPPELRHRFLDMLRRARQKRDAERAPFERLTPREKEVLRGLCDGRSVTDIATDWVVSVPTVRTQVRAILTKLDVGSQLEAVAQANRFHWFAADSEPMLRSA